MAKTNTNPEPAQEGVTGEAEGPAASTAETGADAAAVGIQPEDKADDTDTLRARIAELEGQLAQTDKERIAAADELAALKASIDQSGFAEDGAVEAIIPDVVLETICTGSFADFRELAQAGAVMFIVLCGENGRPIMGTPAPSLTLDDLQFDETARSVRVLREIETSAALPPMVIRHLLLANEAGQAAFLRLSAPLHAGEGMKAGFAAGTLVFLFADDPAAA